MELRQLPGDRRRRGQPGTCLARDDHGPVFLLLLLKAGGGPRDLQGRRCPGCGRRSSRRSWSRPRSFHRGRPGRALPAAARGPVWKTILNTERRRENLQKKTIKHKREWKVAKTARFERGRGERTASGVPGDAFGPWDLDFPNPGEIPRPPRPFRTLGEQPLQDKKHKQFHTP